jgi:hypothetical protein
MGTSPRPAATSQAARQAPSGNPVRRHPPQPPGHGPSRPHSSSREPTGFPLHLGPLQECIPAVPERQRLTPAEPNSSTTCPAPGRRRTTQAAAAIRAYADPVTEDRHELLISHGNLINWFVAQALDAPDEAWLCRVRFPAPAGNQEREACQTGPSLNAPTIGNPALCACLGQSNGSQSVFLRAVEYHLSSD